MSHLSVQTKPDSFFKAALLPSKTSTTSEILLMNKCVVFYSF
jgi:hypothetical protein